MNNNEENEKDLYMKTEELKNKEDKIIEGDGYIYYENGDIYNGHIENGMKNGKGKIIYNNGNEYDGEWKNDKKTN